MSAIFPHIPESADWLVIFNMRSEAHQQNIQRAFDRRRKLVDLHFGPIYSNLCEQVGYERALKIADRDLEKKIQAIEKRFEKKRREIDAYFEPHLASAA